MKTGKTLSELAQEIERMEKSKKDYIAPTNMLEMVPRFQVGEARPVGLDLAIQGNGQDLITNVAHGQISDRLSIPKKYYDRMRHDAPELLANNVNHWLKANPEKRMIRTLDGQCRAFLSDKYKPMDNFSILSAALPVLLNDVKGLEVKSCELTEKRMYIQATTPRIAGEVKKGQMVCAGLVISNSEVGLGRVTIDRLIYYYSCSNGQISGQSFSKHHVGKRIDTGDEVSMDFYAEETMEADNNAFMLKVRDTVRAAFNDDFFQADLQRARDALERKSPANQVQQVIEDVSKKWQFSQGETDGILTRMIEGGDLNQFGLSAAITNLANTVDDYDRAIELERLGGRVIDLAPSEWSSIVKAA